MKKILVTILRDKTTSIEHYRQAAEQLGTVLAIESGERIPKTTSFIDTPLTKTHGVCFSQEVILVPILRAGLVALLPFLRYYPNARVGFIGARRNEKTAEAELYYMNLPKFTKNNPILILDPMVATGGSAILAVQILKDAGAIESQITLVSYIAAPEGLSHFQTECPGVSVIVAQVDEGLNKQKFIVPGLGDFGDRYFGT